MLALTSEIEKCSDAADYDRLMRLLDQRERARQIDEIFSRSSLLSVLNLEANRSLSCKRKRSGSSNEFNSNDFDRLSNIFRSLFHISYFIVDLYCIYHILQSAWSSNDIKVAKTLMEMLVRHFCSIAFRYFLNVSNASTGYLQPENVQP